jgi:hypothetical protein
MTSIPALLPVTSVLPNAAGAENNPRAMTTGPDFQSQLKAQSNSPLLPPGPASVLVLSESAADLSRRPDVEAMLQLLAGRKITSNVPSKAGRSVPGALASGLAIPDYSFADHTVLVSAEMINLTLADEHSSALCPEPIEEPTAWHAESYGDDIFADAPWGGINAAAIAVALSGSTLIWIPSETVRAPLQSPRIRIWGRRKPLPDQPESDVDDNHG